MVSGKRGPNASSVRTRAIILDAALQTLREEGIADTSARAIARNGDFNQALIFYHFGSVDDALVAAFERLCASLRDRYRTALANVTNNQELRSTMLGLFADDLASGTTTTVAQGLAGIQHRPHMAAPVNAHISTWVNTLVDTSIRLGTEPGTAQRHAATFLSLYVGYDLTHALTAPQKPNRALENEVVAFGLDKAPVAPVTPS